MWEDGQANRNEVVVGRGARWNATGGMCSICHAGGQPHWPTAACPAVSPALLGCSAGCHSCHIGCSTGSTGSGSGNTAAIAVHTGMGGGGRGKHCHSM